MFDTAIVSPHRVRFFTVRVVSRNRWFRFKGTFHRRILYRKIARNTIARTLWFRTARYLEENKSHALRLHRHCGGECLREQTIVTPTTMQSRAPIDVSCEAAKDITFSCLRYPAATIIRPVRAYAYTLQTYYSLFVEEFSREPVSVTATTLFCELIRFLQTETASKRQGCPMHRHVDLSRNSFEKRMDIGSCLTGNDAIIEFQRVTRSCVTDFVAVW